MDNMLCGKESYMYAVIRGDDLEQNRIRQQLRRAERSIYSKRSINLRPCQREITGREGEDTNLVKRTCVLEAALPHFIYSLFCRRFVGAGGVGLDREHSSPPNAVLEPCHTR